MKLGRRLKIALNKLELTSALLEAKQEDIINVEYAATEQEMEEYMNAEKEAMRQEMLGDQYHEQQMYNDTDYFCEYVTENLMILTKNKQYIGIDDVLDALNKECDKYGYSIDILLNYMKEI